MYSLGKGLDEMVVNNNQLKIWVQSFSQTPGYKLGSVSPNLTLTSLIVAIRINMAEPKTGHPELLGGLSREAQATPTQPPSPRAARTNTHTSPQCC